MANPLLKRFAQADLLVRIRVRNLFWILIGVSLGLGVIDAITILDGGSLTPLVVSGAIAGFVLAFVFLINGAYRTAATITFVFLVAAATGESLLNRSGYVEHEFFQVMAYFSLALTVTSIFGYSGILGILLVAAGASTMVLVFLTPLGADQLVNSVAYLNSDSNLNAVVLLYLISGVIGSFSLFEYDWILRQMRMANETIEAYSHTLEDKVVERTSAVRNLMDNTGQGFFSFGADFLVEPEFSRGCVDMFKKPIAGLRAETLLFPMGGDPASEFVQGLDLFFQGKSKAKVIIDLLDKSAYIEGRSLSIDYRESTGNKILVILTDITVARQLAERNRAEADRQTIILRALNHKHYFAGFLEEANKLFDTLATYEDNEPNRQEIESLLRHLHTFKGNSGFFSFQSTQEVAHDFEYAVSDSLVLNSEIPFADFIVDLKRSYFRELHVITDIMGKDWLNEAGGIVIPRITYNHLSKYVRTKFPDEPKLIAYLEHYRKIPLKELFSQFPYLAANTAERLGKKIETMTIKGGDLRVVPERFEALVESCVHIVNNMVDHGIEYTYEREAHQKPAAGTLAIVIDHSSESLSLLFRDDGRGVSAAEVERIAREKGLLTGDQPLPPQAILEFLFHDGFSTRSEVSQVSGRGVGLAAVKEEVVKLGGTIRVNTKVGHGTEFEILLPLKTAASRQNDVSAAHPERRKT
jgi:two-component system chemotaxis sensor kinase CheA